MSLKCAPTHKHLLKYVPFYDAFYSNTDLKEYLKLHEKNIGTYKFSNLEFFLNEVETIFIDRFCDSFQKHQIIARDSPYYSKLFTDAVIFNTISLHTDLYTPPDHKSSYKPYTITFSAFSNCYRISYRLDYIYSLQVPMFAITGFNKINC